MHKTDQSFLTLFAIIVLSVMMVLDVGYAQPVVKLEVNPDIQIIPIGVDIEDIFIEALVDSSDYQFTWSLDGPGKLDESSMSPNLAQ